MNGVLIGQTTTTHSLSKSATFLYKKTTTLKTTDYIRVLFRGCLLWSACKEYKSWMLTKSGWGSISLEGLWKILQLLDSVLFLQRISFPLGPTAVEEVISSSVGRVQLYTMKPFLHAVRGWGAWRRSKRRAYLMFLQWMILCLPQPPTSSTGRSSSSVEHNSGFPVYSALANTSAFSLFA